MSKPFQLHVGRPIGVTPVEPDEHLPAEVAGQPAAYFWKEMIHAGNYVHPNRKFSLNVDGDRLARWANVGERMLAAGVAVPINCDHSDRARDVVGYVKRFKLDGDQLLGLCQFIGPDAALVAARNQVSVGIDPDFTDGEARNWGEAIVHLALTPVPVVSDQGAFMDAADDETLVLDQDEAAALEIACTEEQLERLGELLPDGDDLTEENCVERIIEYLELGADEETSELSAARRELLQLSARVPPPLGEDAEAALVEAATTKLDTAVARGGLSPVARDRLIETLVRGGDGRANLYALSRAANPSGDQSLALAVADILLENQAIPLGEQTGLQAFARPVPGEDSSPIEQLRQYMTKVASVSG